MVAEAEGVDMEQAFSALRKYARSHNLRLVDVAERIISRSQTTSTLGVAPEQATT